MHLQHLHHDPLPTHKNKRKKERNNLEQPFSSDHKMFNCVNTLGTSIWDSFIWLIRQMLIDLNVSMCVSTLDTFMYISLI